MPRGYSVVVDGKRRCIQCGDTKVVEEFYRYPYTTNQGKRSQRYDSRCKPCGRIRRRKDYTTHVEARKAVSRVWKERNRAAMAEYAARKRLADLEGYRAAKRASEALRKYNISLPRGEAAALVRQVLDEARIGDKWVDAYDGVLIDNPEVDHIVPLKHGGKHEYDNLCVTSKTNNSRKHARPMLYWLAIRRAA